MADRSIPHQDPGHLAVSIIGLHLTWFAAPEVSSAVVGADVFDPSVVQQRALAVREQVRRLTGAQLAPNA